MNQTRLGSLIEEFINILIGFNVSLLSNIILFPFFGIVASFATNFHIGLCFTIVSLMRSYTLRRIINRYLRGCGQTRMGSLAEQLWNVGIGFLTSLLAQCIIFPLFDIRPSADTHILLALWFTAISTLRGYIIRRWFNRMLKESAQNWANGYFRLFGTKD